MRKLKKALPIALVIMALFSLLALGVSAADCNHPEFTYEDSPYDCTSNYRVYTCTTCGYSYDDQIIGVNNHEYEGNEVEAPTCTTSGTMEYTCQNCGDSYTETISAIGHEWVEQYHAPTCSEKGWSNGVCNNCGAITYEEDYYVEYPPTGYHVYVDGKCSECGISVGDTCVHDFGYVSCGAETHISKCGKCGLTQGEEISHVWSNRTLMEQGRDEMHYIFQYTCSVCKATKTQEESIVCSSEGDHNWLYWNIDGQYHYQACTTCGETREKTVHTFGDGVVLQSPSLNVEGITRYTCTLCNYYKEEVAPALTINDVLNRCTNKEAVQLFDALYNKFMPAINTDSAVVDILEQSGLSEFVYDIYPDMVENGPSSQYWSEYATIYYDILRNAPEGSVEYQQGYQDAISAVVDKNPVQGLFQGMWAGVVNFLTIVGNGVGIGGTQLFSIMTTVVVLLLVWFVIKVIKGK